MASSKQTSYEPINRLYHSSIIRQHTNMFYFVAFAVLASFFPNSLGQTCLVTDFEQVLKATRTCKDICIENLSVPGGKTLKLNLTEGATVTFKGRTVFEFNTYWKGPLVTINGTSVTIQGDEGITGQTTIFWAKKQVFKGMSLMARASTTGMVWGTRVYQSPSFSLFKLSGARLCGIFMFWTRPTMSCKLPILTEWSFTIGTLTIQQETR